MIILDYILLGIIITIALIVLREFIISKNGMLRKIMIAFFATEIWVYILMAIYLHQNVQHYFAYFIPLILIPKTIVKIILLNYLQRNKKLNFNKKLKT